MARSEKILLWLGVMLVAAVLLSLHMGRYPLDMGALCRALTDAWSGNTLNPDQKQVLFLYVRTKLKAKIQSVHLVLMVRCIAYLLLKSTRLWNCVCTV